VGIFRTVANLLNIPEVAIRGSPLRQITLGKSILHKETPEIAINPIAMAILQIACHKNVLYEQFDIFLTQDTRTLVF